MDENHLIDVIDVYKQIDLKKELIQQETNLESDGDKLHIQIMLHKRLEVKITYSLNTPRATLYEHNETPRGSIYWEPHTEGIPIPVEGTYFDTLDESIDMYTNYAQMGGFEVKKSQSHVIQLYN
ncbi:hypothetical protein Tco_0034578, partial [Tanacetum coccineum]